MIQNKIRAVRKKNHMTQKTLSERLGVARQTISKWEYGLAVPDADRLVQIADLFDLNISELLEKDEATEACGIKSEETFILSQSKRVDPSSNKRDSEEQQGEMPLREKEYEKVAGNFLAQSQENADWDKVARQLERYNFLCSQRVTLWKQTIKWFIILIVSLCLLLFAYKLYEMHFYAISDVNVNTLKTESPVSP